jgi:hypothetical protein
MIRFIYEWLPTALVVGFHAWLVCGICSMLRTRGKRREAWKGFKYWFCQDGGWAFVLVALIGLGLYILFPAYREMMDDYQENL